MLWKIVEIVLKSSPLFIQTYSFRKREEDFVTAINAIIQQFLFFPATVSFPQRVQLPSRFKTRFFIMFNYLTWGRDQTTQGLIEEGVRFPSMQIRMERSHRVL